MELKKRLNQDSNSERACAALHISRRPGGSSTRRVYINWEA